MRSQVLGAWIRVSGEGKAQRLRLAADPSGETLLLTEAETQLQAERALREEAEAMTAEADADIARLRAELLRRG